VTELRGEVADQGALLDVPRGLYGLGMPLPSVAIQPDARGGRLRP
jgi:hypothetical protein